MSQSLEQRIYGRLMDEIQPEKLAVINQSHLHVGHAGDNGSGQSHFKVEIWADKLSDLPAVARERAVYKALAEEMSMIHALSIQFMKP